MNEAGVGEITVRLDKGFISKEMVKSLQELDVFFLMMVPRYRWLEEHRKRWHHSKKGEDFVTNSQPRGWSTRSDYIAAPHHRWCHGATRTPGTSWPVSARTRGHAAGGTDA
ncbi:MAG: hypothetical protein OYK82_09145 [Gammaproteobacteria bacterium]|nr:hypothetical protein [Gammaproteobacteria bacterium]